MFDVAYCDATGGQKSRARFEIFQTVSQPMPPIPAPGPTDWAVSRVHYYRGDEPEPFATQDFSHTASSLGWSS